MKEALAAISTAAAAVIRPAAVTEQSSAVRAADDSVVSSSHGLHFADGISAALADIKDIAELVELSTEEVADLLGPATAAAGSGSSDKDKEGQMAGQALATPGVVQAQQLQQRLEAALAALLTACQQGQPIGGAGECGLKGYKASIAMNTSCDEDSAAEGALKQVVQAWGAAMAVAQSALRGAVGAGVAA